MTERWSKQWWLHPRERPLGAVGTGVAVAVAFVVSSVLADAVFGDLGQLHVGRTVVIAVGAGLLISLLTALTQRHRTVRRSRDAPDRGPQ